MKTLSNLFKRSEKKSKKNIVQTILFADIANSTRLYEILGDKKARSMVAGCLSRLSVVTSNNNGMVIKTIGDEIMCTFDNPDDAVNSSIDMHLGISEMQQMDPSTPNIQVGFHTGPVIREGDDVFGDAVNVAARMVELAKQRQIITTEHTAKGLGTSYKSMLRKVERTTIKGKTGQIDIYELIWDRQEATFTVAEDLFKNVKIPKLARMELKNGDQVINVDQSKPSVTIGRLGYNDLVVDSERVSRSHARIEYRRGKFLLIDDKSTNGTFVLTTGSVFTHIHRDQITLTGEGIIGLGEEVNPDSPQAIYYKIIKLD